MATPLTAKEWEEKHDAIWTKAEAEAEEVWAAAWAAAAAEVKREKVNLMAVAEWAVSGGPIEELENRIEKRETP